MEASSAPSGREFKDAVYAHFARVAAGFGHPKRVEIIDVLSNGERSVESLANAVSSSVANTSRHLQVLAGAGMVVRRAEGTTRIYSISDPRVAESYHRLVGLAEHRIADVAALASSFFGAVDGSRPVTLAELDQLAESGQVVVVDVRPENEFATGHLEGAINIPVSELAERMAELPVGTPVVAYCRGPYCVMSAYAVRDLRAAGYQAVRLEDGFPELNAT